MHAKALMGGELRLSLGEGPVWEVSTQRLWWVDSEAGLVFRGRLDGESLTVDTTWDMGERVGSVTPAADGGFLIAGERHVHIHDDGGSLIDSVRLIPQEQASRLNDGTCDAAGRFLVGSIRLDDRTGEECLWAVEPDRSVRPVVPGMSVSNGIGFSPDGRTMYFVETRPGTIVACDYDVDSGAATGRRELLACGETPDGLAVDAEGNLWVAFFGRGEVRRMSPAGEVLTTMTMDAPNTTCPEFAGPDLDRLIVTSARFRMDDEALSRWPLSGAIFVGSPGVVGLAPTPWSGSTRR